MGKSWRIAVIKGIPIYLHWTLGLFLMFFIWFSVNQSQGLESTLIMAGFIFCLFACILLHELGHALTALRYGIQTKDIILSPIGGLARLENIPDNPKQEFIIAINGPLVNLLIAIILFSFLMITGMELTPELRNGKLNVSKNSFLQLLLVMNVAVFLFNLIPAFPMDGGRILRSILSSRIGKTRATFWAAFLGRVIAIGFFVFAIYNNHLVLGLIGPFIFFVAGREYKQVKLQDLMRKTNISSLYRSNYTRLYDHDKIDKVLTPQIEGEFDYLVFDENEKLSGSLPYIFIEEIRKKPSEYNLIKNIKSKNYSTLDIGVSIDQAFQVMNKNGVAIIGVTQENHIIGVIDRPLIARFISSNSRMSLLG